MERGELGADSSPASTLGAHLPELHLYLLKVKLDPMFCARCCLLQSRG